MTLFDSANQRPVAQIVSRRHPMAVCLYLTIFVLGLVFVFHWYGTGKDQSQLFPGIPWYVIFMWKWELVMGGGIALLALWTKPRQHPHWPGLADLLHIEGIGAIVAAFGLTTYLVAVVELVGFDHAGPPLGIYLPLILGHVYRGVQAINEGKRLEALVNEIRDDEEAHNR